MDEIEIVGLPQSNFVWATRIAAAEKGVPHRLTAAPPHSPEVAALHPLGRIPLLRHGEVTVAESRAICLYIDRTFPGPTLMPTEPRDAALAEQWLSVVATGCEPVLIRHYAFAYFFPGTADGQPDRERIAAQWPEVERRLDVLDGAVSAPPFATGFTLADAYLWPILFYLRNLPETGEALKARPALSGYLDRGLARPSVRGTMPPPL